LDSTNLLADNAHSASSDRRIPSRISDIVVVYLLDNQANMPVLQLGNPSEESAPKEFG